MKTTARLERSEQLLVLLSIGGSEYPIAGHFEPQIGQLLRRVECNFRRCVEFQIAFISDDTLRNQIASHLFSSLSGEQWNRVLVIAPSQIYAALRWIEDQIEGKLPKEIVGECNNDESCPSPEIQRNL